MVPISYLALWGGFVFSVLLPASAGLGLYVLFATWQ